jgi:hypothetical protein
MLNEIEIYFRDLSTDAQHAVLDAVNKGGSVDIMLDDLEDDKQAELLDSAGVTDPEMMNWDTMPVTVVEFDPPKPGDPPVRRAEDMNWDTIPLTTWEYEDELEEDVFDVEENPKKGTMRARMTGADELSLRIESDEYLELVDINEDAEEADIPGLLESNITFLIERKLGARSKPSVVVHDWELIAKDNSSTDTILGTYSVSFGDESQYDGNFVADGISQERGFVLESLYAGSRKLKYYG